LRRRRLPRWAAPLLLGLLCLVVYNANLRTIGAGDTLPARYLPLTLWHDGTFDLDSSARLVAHGHRFATGRKPATPQPADNYYEPPGGWMIRVDDGRLASVYPIVAPLLATPLYLPAMLALDTDGWKQPDIDRWAQLMEKISASVFAAIASVLMFLVLRREGYRWAFPLALAFAFGTNTWVISSQALWQHGSGELLMVLALLLVQARGSPRRVALLGFVCVLLAANRPPDMLFAAAFLFIAIRRRPRDVAWLAAGGALPLVALLYYNLVFIGNLLGAYGKAEPPGFFHLSLTGIAALFVSPAKGLLVFSPFLAFVVVGLRRRLTTPGMRELAIPLCVAVLGQLVLYSQADWRAGFSWGPRWLTDTLPILIWLLAPATVALRPSTRRLLVATMVFAVAVQAIGAFWYTGTSDERIFAGDFNSKRGAWDPANIPFIVELEHPPADGDLRCDAQGALEQVGTKVLREDGTAAPLEPGATLSGWALTCRRTPAQALLLSDGRIVGTTTTFTPRPDVNKALHARGPTGWTVTANTIGLDPGEHVLQLALLIDPRSDARIVREERVTIAASSQPPAADAGLPVLAARAAQRLRDDQNPAGYWLTAFTDSTAFTAPHDELNTYLTASIVDLLGPFAHERRLDDVVARARAHLAAQIEANGLVRYHGLPNAPTIGTLGCAITPDPDDTALVWRVTGTSKRDPRLRRMLGILARYRDSRGLYRTWLAPQRKYQCINPGRDPDPSDLTIQMHIYMMLRELDPPAARGLCKAMLRVARDDDVNVYYAKAPLVPYLRSAQLQALGCRLPLPVARLARAEPGQEPWAELVRRLVDVGAKPPDAAGRRAIEDLLMRLGQDDFALLRATPPLLYHNDLTASVRRYYWSADAGYALWLRLYEAALPAGG
jgi:hypothetical protein